MAERFTLRPGETAPQGFQRFLSLLPENPFLTTNEVYAAVVLNSRMENLADDYGYTYTGHSWKPGIPYGLFIVKMKQGNDAKVCFIRSDSVLQATAIFCKMLAESRVPWRVDKYSKT